MLTTVQARIGLPNSTALDYAAHYGHVNAVRLLAPIHPPAPFSHTQYLSLALVEAVVGKNTDISKYVISRGADVNFWADNAIFFMVHYAVLSYDLAVVRLLLAHGSDPAAVNPYLSSWLFRRGAWTLWKPWSKQAQTSMPWTPTDAMFSAIVGASSSSASFLNAE